MRADSGNLRKKLAFFEKMCYTVKSEKCNEEGSQIQVRKFDRERMPRAESGAVAGGGISLRSRTGERFL